MFKQETKMVMMLNSVHICEYLLTCPILSFGIRTSELCFDLKLSADRLVIYYAMWGYMIVNLF